MQKATRRARPKTAECTTKPHTQHILDLALADELLEGFDGVLNWRHAILPMQIVQVQTVDAQPFQGFVALGLRLWRHVLPTWPENCDFVAS